MGYVAWIGLVALLLAALVLGVRGKLRRDSIYQDGAYAGSALLAHWPSPGSRQARFAIVRGSPAFREGEAFEHRGWRFRIESYARLDDHSDVLRRFIDVTCEVEPAARKG